MTECLRETVRQLIRRAQPPAFGGQRRAQCSRRYPTPTETGHERRETMTTIDEIRAECEAQFCPAWVKDAVRKEVWDKAWEYGHSAGASEVAFYYDNLMDIVRAMGPTNPTPKPDSREG